jgi:hypothetical protein
VKNLFALILACALAMLSPAEAATTSTSTPLVSTAYTDLGAGPIYLGADGVGVVYLIGDSQPAANASGLAVQQGAGAIALQTTSHVWAKLVGPGRASAIVFSGSGITSAGGGANSAYTLASGVNAAGATTPVSGIVGASYVLACVSASWAGVSVQLQALGPDGTTYLNVGTALSANGTLGVVIGANATARLNVTGTPSGLACSIS